MKNKNIYRLESAYISSRYNPLGRAGEPKKIAPASLFLTSDDIDFKSGHVIRPNGGEFINR